MVVDTCVCVGQLGAYTIASIHGPSHWWIKCKKINKCVVASLLQQGGLGQTYIVAKLVAFGLDGVNVFQGAKFGETKQIQEACAPFNLGVHCVSHRTNLVIHTLFYFPLVY
jgi:hypothetical protein